MPGFKDIFNRSGMSYGEAVKEADRLKKEGGYTPNEVFALLLPRLQAKAVSQVKAHIFRPKNP